VNPLLLILLCPAVAVLLLFFVGPENKRLVRAIATIATGIALATALTLFFGFGDAPVGETVAGTSHVYKYTWTEKWIPTLGLSFSLGVDGISMALVLLTAFTIFTGVLVSYRIETRVKEYYISLLALVTGVFGVFVSLDMFFYYFFYELAVIPMFLLIGIWGSTTRTVDQRYATMKLVLVLSAGAALALVGLIAVYVQGWRQLGHPTFSLLELETVAFTSAFQMIWFIPVFLGFASLVPMWPLHSWSPAGHAAAPAAVSMLHAGVLMKLGAYGIVRLVLPWFPDASHTYLPWVAGLCCMNILYGGFVAIAQRDMKLIIGYSSSSHMGYVLLGIASLTALGVEGAVFLMFAHGIMTALAFSLIGFFYDQTHTRMLDDLGGMMKAMPFIGTCFVIASMASAGLPGFANFVSEMMVILGAWQSTTIWSKVPAILAIWGLVVTGVYLLRAVKDAWFGELPARWKNLRDARTFGERAPFAILVGVLLVFGFWPQPMLDVIRQGTNPLLERVGVQANGLRVGEKAALPPTVPAAPDTHERGAGGAR
jgi:NADH-quinone oxidoreductase subunit M